MEIKKYSGAVSILLSAILYASYGIWSVLLGKDFGIFFQEYVRSIIVLIFLIPICFFTKSWQKIEKENYKYFLIVSLFGAFSQVFIYYAFQHSSIGITTLILFSTSLLTSFLLGKFLLGEKFTAVKWVAFILSSIGLFLIFYNSFGDYSLAALLMAGLGGFAFGGETSYSKLIPQKFYTIQTSIVAWIFGVIVCLPISLFLGEKQIIPNFNISWLVMSVYAIAGLFAYYLLIDGYKKVDASVGGLIGILEIVFGVLFGVLFFKEKLSLNIALGGVLILVAASLPHIKKFQAKVSD